jgi:hypothetical protein
MTERALAALHAHIDELEEALRQWKALAAPTMLVPHAWGLSRQQAQIVAALMAAKGNYVSLERLHFIMSNGERDTSPRIVQVQMCHARRKLSRHGVSIEGRYILGWRLPPAAIAKIAAVVLDEWREGLPGAIAVLRQLAEHAEAAKAALDRAAAPEPRA